jgi:hypothetical protein
MAIFGSRSDTLAPPAQTSSLSRPGGPPALRAPTTAFFERIASVGAPNPGHAWCVVVRWAVLLRDSRSTSFLNTSCAFPMESNAANASHQNCRAETIGRRYRRYLRISPATSLQREHHRLRVASCRVFDRCSDRCDGMLFTDVTVEESDPFTPGIPALGKVLGLSS